MPEVRLIAFPMSQGSLSSSFTYPIACAVLFAFHFVALGDTRALLSGWPREAQLLAFPSLFVHVCHLSGGLIQIVLWLRDRRFACVYKEGDGPLCLQPSPSSVRGGGWSENSPLVCMEISLPALAVPARRSNVGKETASHTLRTAGVELRMVKSQSDTILMH